MLMMDVSLVYQVQPENT